MGKIIQLFLHGIDGKTAAIHIDEEASIEQLIKIINEKTRVSKDEMRIYGLNCRKELQETDEYNKKQYLLDYNIQDKQSLAIVLRLCGVSDLNGKTNVQVPGLRTLDIVEQHENLPQPPKVLGPDVELTSEPDMITFDDDRNVQRAKMPCGHAIGPESLTAYCRSLLSDGEYEFKCPSMNPSYCGQQWDFFYYKESCRINNS